MQALPNTLTNDLAPFITDRTASEFDPQFAGYVQGSGLLVQFYYVNTRITSVDPAEDGKVVQSLCIAKKPKGDRHTIAHRRITPEQAQRQFPREYALFVQGEDLPADGTPLSELPGMSQSQISLLALSGLRSIEDLAGIGEDRASQLGMDAVRAYKMARRWIDKRDANAEAISAAQIEASAKAAMDAAEARIKKMEEYVKALEAKIEFASRGQPGQAAALTGPRSVDDSADLPVDDGYDPFTDGEAVASPADPLDD